MHARLAPGGGDRTPPSLKNLIFHPLDISSYHAIFRPIPSLLKGRCRDACSAGRDAAPAGVGVVPCAPGGPWVTVRAHYGALPSVAGRGRRRVGESLPGWRVFGLAPVPEARPQGRRSRCDGASEGRIFTTKARLSALRLPSKRGDQLKAQLARRRGNVKLCATKALPRADKQWNGLPH